MLCVVSMLSWTSNENITDVSKSAVVEKTKLNVKEDYYHLYYSDFYCWIIYSSQYVWHEWPWWGRQDRSEATRRRTCSVRTRRGGWEGRHGHGGQRIRGPTRPGKQTTTSPDRREWRLISCPAAVIACTLYTHTSSASVDIRLWSERSRHDITLQLFRVLFWARLDKNQKKYNTLLSMPCSRGFSRRVIFCRTNGIIHQI